jgi:two-component system CheB/CheR fusion protein
VEDDVDAAATLAMLIEMEGHQAQTVHEGPAAPEAVRRFKPDVVLLDLGLPGMDGYQVARRLREEHGRKGVTLIAITGYRQDEQRLKEAGFDGHLLKPPDMDTLFGWLGSPPPEDEAS